jgi:hypothetical protein
MPNLIILDNFLNYSLNRHYLINIIKIKLLSLEENDVSLIKTDFAQNLNYGSK